MTYISVVRLEREAQNKKDEGKQVMKKKLSKLTTEEKLKKDREQIAKYRPIDDTFFEKIAEDKEVCEEILRIILMNEKLKVISVTPQNSIKNLQGRSVRLDALCDRGDGTRCNIEVHRSGNEDALRRVRYNASCITANIVDPGEDFKNIPDVDSVYISDQDIFKLHRCIYHVGPMIRETNTLVDNGHHEVYVNTVYDDGSTISELMQCFLQTEVNNPKFPKLSARVNYLKNSEKGVKYMCAISEEIKEEGRMEAVCEAISKMLKKLTPEEIIELGYDPDLVMEIAEEVA